MLKCKALAAAAATSLLLIAGCADDDHNGHDENEEFNEADYDYLAATIEHHQQAVLMSEIVMNTEDIDPEVNDLAHGIKVEQEKEIQLMSTWLIDWDHYDDDHDYHSQHPGMLSEEDIADLGAADGEETMVLFLEQMIEHHEGAIVAAEEHLAEGENEEALELSEDIIADQTAEIELMQDLLAEL